MKINLGEALKLFGSRPGIVKQGSLRYLQENGESKVSEIAESLSLKPDSVSTALCRMVENRECGVERVRHGVYRVGDMEEAEKLTVGSLFAGIGGIDLGLERAGMRVIWQVEKDAFCNRVLGKHWKDVDRHGDIREFNGEDVETPDVVCGGFPCQPVSSAGKRKAQGDPRWLWPEFYRVVSEVRPKYVLIENVSGLYHRGLSGIICDLAKIGYNAEWDSLPAAAFGAPHRRDRVFIVAYTTCERKGYERIISRGGKSPARCSTWNVEPSVGRVADGVPDRVDRLRALGNSVVPQVAEYVGRGIIEFHKNGED